MGSLLLVAFSLSLSNFAAAIGIGLTGIDTKTRIKTGIAFGFFEALMPILGLLIGRRIVDHIGHLGQYVGTALLVGTGVYTLWQARKVKQEHPQADDGRLTARQLIITAFVLSLDNLIVGFALSLSYTPIALAAIVIAVASVLMSLVGLELGQLLGERVERWSEEIGGVVLVLVGIAIGTGLFG